MRNALLGLVLLFSPAMTVAQNLPGAADIALLAKVPPKSREKASPAKMEAAISTDPNLVGASGYDYFHLMAEPAMAGQPTFASGTPKRRTSPPKELRDAVASPRPQPKAATR